MKKLLLAFTVVAGGLLGGCASPDAVTSSESPSTREYPTGSNIPRKSNAKAAANIPMGEGVRVHSREDLERMQNSTSSGFKNAKP
jgi:hypothetical protein